KKGIPVRRDARPEPSMFSFSSICVSRVTRLILACRGCIRINYTGFVLKTKLKSWNYWSIPRHFRINVPGPSINPACEVDQANESQWPQQVTRMQAASPMMAIHHDLFVLPLRHLTSASGELAKRDKSGIRDG